MRPIRSPPKLNSRIFCTSHDPSSGDFARAKQPRARTDAVARSSQHVHIMSDVGTLRLWVGISVALATATVAPEALAAPKAGSVIEIWRRGDGPSGDQGPPHERARRVSLDHIRLENVERYDAQYARVEKYRGVPLQTLLDQLPDKWVDLAILHFANGMAIPLPFRDQVTMKRLAPFVARGSTFPAIPKKDTPLDRRPIEFSGNKLVVADRWHPDVLPESQPGFSPWVHADTLVGIELVAAGPYYAQFEASTEPGARRGSALFRQSCQFCHGVHRVGATFGWDFVDSPAINSYEDSSANLYHNVAYKPRNAAELGLMMPPLAFLTEAAADDVRQWLRAISSAPLPPYRGSPRAGLRPAP